VPFLNELNSFIYLFFSYITSLKLNEWDIILELFIIIALKSSKLRQVYSSTIILALFEKYSMDLLDLIYLLTQKLLMLN